jgi:hypothetical protein
MMLFTEEQGMSAVFREREARFFQRFKEAMARSRILARTCLA